MHWLGNFIQMTVAQIVYTSSNRSGFTLGLVPFKPAVCGTGRGLEALQIPGQQLPKGLQALFDLCIAAVCACRLQDPSDCGENSIQSGLHAKDPQSIRNTQLGAIQHIQAHPA